MSAGSGLRRAVRAAAAAIAAATVAASAGTATKTVQSTRLYTAPDASALGGIQGRIRSSSAPDGVYAMPQLDQTRVYRAELGPDGRAFAFSGLPVGKYDLVVVCRGSFREGLTLSRGDSTLTPQDLKLIEKTIMESGPFFDRKEIHRASGATGREGRAQCVLQEVRTRPVTLQSAEVRSDIQVRSLKLASLEDVGAVGWHLVRTREIARIEVGPGDPKGVIRHAFSEKLTGIRVADAVKDIGELNLD